MSLTISLRQRERDLVKKSELLVKEFMDHLKEFHQFQDGDSVLEEKCECVVMTRNCLLQKKLEGRLMEVRSLIKVLVKHRGRSLSMITHSKCMKGFKRNDFIQSWKLVGSVLDDVLVNGYDFDLLRVG